MDYMLQGQDQHYKTGFHGKPLIIAWLPLVNFAVLFASIRWCKYSFYCHVILALGVITLTLFSTIHILVDDWLQPNRNFKIQYVHNIAGLGVTIWLALQVFLGLLSRVIQYSPNVKTNTCVWVKRMHQISGYFIMLVSKFNYLNIKFMKGKYIQFAEYFFVQLVFLGIYLWIKSSYWTLSEEIVDGQLITFKKQARENQISLFLIRIKNRLINLKNQVFQKQFIMLKVNLSLPIINSQSEIPISDYVLFNDYVYDISKFKQLHPGGERIIKLTRKKQIDRFLYGYYKPQPLAYIKSHSHTKQSLRLCGKPIAKIRRISPMEGFDGLSKVMIQQCRLISTECQKYILYLKPVPGLRQNELDLRFVGYNDQSQLCQHFSLTISNSKGRKRCTRLYTSVWCMRPRNLQFMQKHFPNSTKPIFKLPNNIQTDGDLMQSLITTQNNQRYSQGYYYSNQQQQVIPLIVKKYKDGALTQRLLKGQPFTGQIVLSEPMGSGMKYHQLRQSGKVIIICGGTGLLPFCDLVDLLFKRVKYLEKTNISEHIQGNDNIISKDLIKRRQFIFYYACQQAQDLLPLILYQLNYLCSSNSFIQFKTILRIDTNQRVVKEQFKSLNYQRDFFSDQIEGHLKSKQDICKIYICGPPIMAEQISRVLVKNEVSQDIYYFM